MLLDCEVPFKIIQCNYYLSQWVWRTAKCWMRCWKEKGFSELHFCFIERLLRTKMHKSQAPGSRPVLNRIKSQVKPEMQFSTIYWSLPFKTRPTEKAFRWSCSCVGLRTGHIWALGCPEVSMISTSFSLLSSEKCFAFYQTCPEKNCLKKSPQNNFSSSLKVKTHQIWGKKCLGPHA